MVVWRGAGQGMDRLQKADAISEGDEARSSATDLTRERSDSRTVANYQVAAYDICQGVV
jgi:hypothetical protein